MKANVRIPALFALGILLGLEASLPVHGRSLADPPPPSVSAPPGKARPAPAHLARMRFQPAGFVVNAGQARDGSVAFTLREAGVTAGFTADGFRFWNGQEAWVRRDGREVRVPVMPRWRLTGARPTRPVGGDPLPHTVSYFRGGAPSECLAGLPAYGEIRYPGILEGIELRIARREGGIEYSFHVEPGADPDLLRLGYDGIERLELSARGDLLVHTAAGTFAESRPVAWQSIDGEQAPVECRFELEGTAAYRIVVGDHDRSRALVIDPVLDWSTFLGASYLDELRDVQADAAGNVFVVGNTYSADLPDNAGFGTGPGVNFDAGSQTWHYDVVVARFDPSGTQLAWLGYLGGNLATDDMAGFSGLAMDSQGDLVVAGFTASPDFPAVNAHQPVRAGGDEAFVTRIRGDGSQVVWSTFLGGGGLDWAMGVAIDGQDNVLVTGFSESGDFPVAFASDPTLGGGQDAFVAKYGPAGGLQWATFLGGDAGTERASSVVADASGGAVVFGDTDSADFPVSPGVHDGALGGVNDAFVARFDAAGARLWSTFLGGSGAENDSVQPFSAVAFGRGEVALDSAGGILVAGETQSADFPVTAGALDTVLGGAADAYVAKLSPDGTSLLWATYLGGTGSGAYQDRAWGLAVNPWDEVVITGRTDSADFPTTADGVQPVFRGGLQDGFLVKLAADGSRVVYGTYLGGAESRDTALGVAWHSGRIHVTGWALSAGFPVTTGAYQGACATCGAGWDDSFVATFLDAFVAWDGFESAGTAGGLGAWAGPWAVTQDAPVQPTGTPHSGGYHARLRAGTGSLRRTVNVAAGTVSLRLGYWSRFSSFESADRAEIRARAVGGVASLTNLVTAANAAALGDVYRYHEMDLTSLLPAAQVEVTFAARMNANNDVWYLDDIRVTGTAGLVPPAANVGPDQTVEDDDDDGWQEVTLDGSASSDPDGTIVAYAWTAPNLPPLGDTAIITPSLPVGTHVVTLTVTDDDGLTHSDSVTVVVREFSPEVLAFEDGFETGEWNGLWAEDSQNDWFRSSRRATAGSWSAEVDGAASGATLTSVPIPVSGRTEAVVVFDWRIQASLDRGERLEFLISKDNGPWTPVASLQGNLDPEDVWRAESRVIGVAGAGQLRVRFLGTMDRADEAANVDRVQVWIR